MNTSPFTQAFLLYKSTLFLYNDASISAKCGKERTE